MPKKDANDESKMSQSTRGERMPPPLGADLIAKLQAAVDAAQRKRRGQPAAQAESTTDE